jgi:hypothetical protein
LNVTNLKSAAVLSVFAFLLVLPAGPLRALPDNTLGMALMSVSAYGSTVLHNSGAQSITNTGAGTYEIIFDRNIVDCVHIGSVTNTGSADFGTWRVKVRQLSSEPTKVRILTTQSNGTLTTFPFSLLVFCPK